MSDPTYKRVEWDETGKKFYDAGVDRVVCYPMKNDGTYESGEAWNGITNVSENPSGGDINDFYANNHLYASLRAVEKPEGSIEAYTYPDCFAECDGSKELVQGTGVLAKHQKRRAFGMTYRNFVGEGDDPEGVKTIEGEDRQHYIIHILYGLTVSPSERSHDTINEDPDLEPLSWDYSGVPMPLTEASGFRPMGAVEIDSHKVTKAQLEAIEGKLYGTTTDSTANPAVPGNAPTILTPDDLYTLLTTA